MASIVVAPAIMASEWDDLVMGVIDAAEYATHAQIDVMDGHLVPSFSFPYNKTMLDGRPIPRADDLFLEVHLMVQHPAEVGQRFIHAGVRRVTAQVEGFREGEARTVLEEWKEMGSEVGVSLMLDTPLEDVHMLLMSGVVDVVQLMSIKRIGFQGEAFDTRVYERIKAVKAQYPSVRIAVDGGVSMDTAHELVHAGASMLNVGSAIVKQRDPAKAYSQLQNFLTDA